MTIHSVARAAGVSSKTVSRVLNLEPGVHEATAKHVESVMASLGYRRNDLARNLRKGIDLPSVGLLIEDLGNPFYAYLARAVEEVAQRNGHAVVLTSSGEDASRERPLLEGLLQRGVDGLLVVPASHDHRYLVPYLRRGIRLVFVDRAPTGLDADAVLLDNVTGARRGVEHLIAYGHRRIGFVGDPLSVPTSAERLHGYHDALREASIAVDEALVRAGPPRVEQAEASARQLLTMADPPTAIFAQNNRNCVGVVRAIRAAGTRTALVGFDDFELADMLPTPVTVVSYDPSVLGRSAAELLFARLAGDSRPAQRIVVPTRLLRRGSGEILPDG